MHTPQVPGDKILDAIEAGAADDAILGQYKINNDQLNAFKSLHYGLSNQQMAYDQIEDLYPELNSYFKLPSPLMPKAPDEPLPVPEDPYKLIKERNKLSSKLAPKIKVSGGSMTAGSFSTINDDLKTDKDRMAQIDEQLKIQGYEPDVVSKDLGDLPDLQQFDVAKAMDIKSKNPYYFERYKSAIKSQYELAHAVDKKEGGKAANTFLDNYRQQQISNDYQSQRTATKNAIDAVYKYIDDGATQRKVIKDLIKDRSYGYGVGLPGADDAIMNDPRSQNLNPYQVGALQFLEDTDPAAAQAYDRLLNFTPEERQQLEMNASFARGIDIKGRELESIGMALQQKGLEEKMTAMIADKDKWTDEQKAEYIKLYDQYETLTKDVEDQTQRYPLAAAMDSDRLMQDAMGESKRGVVAKTVLGIGENFDDMFTWVGDMIQAPFYNKKESAVDDLIKLGDKKLAQLSQYETAGQELFNGAFKAVLEPGMQEKVDAIKNNDSLDKEAKQDAIRELLFKNNNRGITYVPNDRQGKMNFTAQSVLNSVSNVVSEVVPQIAIAFMTGGGGNASKARELTSLFGSTFATAYNDYYTQAIEENKPHPSQYALVNTAIEATSELVGNDIEMAKRIFGGKKFGQLLDGVDQDAMNALRKTGRFAALKQSLEATGKTGAKNAFSEAKEEALGQAAGNVANKQLFNEEVDYTDDVMKSGVSAFIGMLPLAGLGLPFQYKSANQMQKYALYQAALNPDKYLAQINEDLQSGLISKSEADTRSATVQKASDILSGMSAVRSDGTVMTDNQKTKYLFNEFVRDGIKDLKKSAPEEIKEQLEKKEEVLNNANNKLLKPEEKDESKTKAEAEAETKGTNITVAESITPADEGTAVINQQGSGTGTAVPAGDQANELHYTNPAGTKYVLRGDRLSYINSKGVEVPFSDNAMQTSSSKELVETIKQANQQSPSSQQNVVIETEQDFEHEVNKIMGNNVQEQLSGNLSNVNDFISPEIFLEKSKKVLSTLFPDLNVEVYDSEAEYFKQNNLKNRSYGFWSPSKNKIVYNLEGIKEDRKNTTVFHEIIHPILNEVFSKDNEALTKLYSELESIGSLPGMEKVWDHFNKYYNRGGKIQKIEALTEFFALVATDQIKLEEKPETTINRIIEFINKLFEAIGVSYRINTYVDLKSLSAAISQAFNDQDLTKLSGLLGKPVGGNETADMEMLADQKDAIRALIKKTPASITDDRLREILVKATGITDQEAQDLIDDVRKPVVSAAQLTHTTGLTSESRRISVAKIYNILDVAPSKEPSWLKRLFESVRNGSAYLDNPYRFITKITEDINKEYNRANNEAIPLGRQFEKSATGRAILKVESFINEVIRGHIDGRNLGRLKGEKYRDFQAYLTSKRIIDRLNKQEEKQLAGENVSRQTGNVDRQDAEVTLEELEKKYGDLNDFAARAKALHEHMDTMLFTLVSAGILSKETYDNIKADNDFYAPFSVVQSKLYAQQDKQPVGISGIVKRIKGIDYNLIKTGSEKLAVLNDLAAALKEKLISPEEYFNSALQVLDDALNQGVIKQHQYDRYIASLENPGFKINDILDAAANMIYKAEGMALRNSMLQRLYAYKAYDKDGLFIQDVDGFDAMTLPDGSTRMVPKPLNSIRVEPGMAPIKLKVKGKDVIVAVNKQAADKLTLMSNYETATVLKVADVANRLFRTIVITVSPGFQVVNFAIDFVRTTMLSRYGLLAGKKPAHTLVNLALFVPQYAEALLHSAAGNLGFETKTYKQWMESDSFSKGMFDNLFDNEKRIKEVNAPLAKRMLMNLLKLKFIDVPGSILEQTHKLATHQRGMSVEGFKPEMFTALLASTINRNINPNMTQQELKDAADRLDYEVQNFAGSPNFPQTHRWMKLTSIFLQFFSARVKGEMTDYRRILNLFIGKGEGVQLSKQEVMQIGGQFLGIMGAIIAFAVINNADDEDEKEFDGMPPFHKDNYLNIPLGYFEWEDENNQTHKLRDYAKVPLRGLTATMNVMANSFIKFMKRHNPEEFWKEATAFIANASPINLHGADQREIGESLMSNLTPIFKFYIEYSFNRDTHNHRKIIPDFVEGRGMLSQYREGNKMPWDVATKKTPQWAKDMSKYLYDTLGVRVSAIEIDHMENTMGNPTELYHKAIKKRLFRSEMKYPLYLPREETKNTSSATVTPVVE